MNYPKLSRTWCLVLLCHLFVASAWSQVRLSGQVTHNDESVSDVTIKVIEDGRVLRTLLADKRGRFETDIPFQKEYTLLFVRPFMIPVAIDVDTRMKESMEVLYEVPLKMRMFYMYEGLDEQVARNSIGIVQRTGSGEEAFSFTPFPSIIEQVKVLYTASSELEGQGATPIASSIFTLKASDQGVGKDAPAVEKPAEQSTKPNDEKPSPVRGVVPAREKEMKAEERFSTIEASKRLEQSEMQASQARSSGSQVDQNAAQQDFILANKSILQQRATEDAAAEHRIADARVMKSERQSQVNTAPLTASPATQAPALIKYHTDDGLFVSEETLLVERNGLRSTFKKAVYHWWLFDVTYYSKDDEEITEEEFTQIKDELGI